MKIIAWNLKNIGHNKLPKPTNVNVANAGYGGNVLSFMMNVVMGTPGLWNGTNLSGVPVDLFMVVELKSGGTAKGGPVTGTGVPCMANILNAMNIVAAGNPAYAGNYTYAQTPGQLTGNHEAVGLIYNTQRLTYVNESVLRNHNNNFLLPRTPYMAEFTINPPGGPPGPSLNVVGIHAPPPQNGAIKFKNPISFCIKLPTCPDLMLGPPENYFIGGDFNCAPNSTWTSGGVAITPFVNAPPPPNRTLTGYATSLPNGTLTSARKKVDNSQPPGEQQYLSGAYDNVLYYPAANYLQYKLDLIGNMIAPGAGLVARLNNFWRVSDHLPVAIDGIPAAQTIWFQGLPANVFGAVTPSVNLLATASSGLPIAFAFTGPATLFGTTLTFTGTGTVTATASQGGNLTYNPATPITQTIQVH